MNDGWMMEDQQKLIKITILNFSDIMLKFTLLMNF